ncbi:hypothetical protein DVDV_3228 [Desulfovibrio sp. DV]|nr:hypothetical protein DVDV_3228 [Desulfovibrio sp. DV]
MEHETLVRLAVKRLDLLLIAGGAERGHAKGLGFAPGEQRGTVGARQHAHFDADGTHRGDVAAIEADAGVLDQGAQQLLLHGLQDLAGLHLVGRGLRKGSDHGFDDGGLDGAARIAAGHLFLDGEGFLELGFAGFAHHGFQLGHGRRRGEDDFGLAGLFAHLFLEVEQRQHGGVAKFQGVSQQILGNKASAAFDHDHRVAGGGEDQIEHGVGVDLGHGRVQHKLAVDVAHPAAGDGAVEGNLGQVQGRGRAGQGQNVRLDGAVGREHRGDDLHFVAEALGEKRPAGAVDQAAHEHFALGGAADFAAEIGTRDAPGSVGHFLVVDDQGEKAFFLGQGLGADRDQHNRAAGLDPDRAISLIGQAAGLDDDRRIADGGLEADGIERHCHRHLMR